METNKPATLCWKCANACGGCSWSDGSFTPVQGWTARKTSVMVPRGKHGTGMTGSYMVEKCPLYEDDRGKYKIGDDESAWY